MANTNEMKWVVYNTRTNTIWKRFYLEQDAQKKRRKILRDRKYGVSDDEFIVEHIGDVTEAQWKMWKQLQKDLHGKY